MANILIIDDEPGIRFLLRTVLTLEGHHVREAENGVMGIRECRKNPPDLMVCDIFMDMMDGFEVLTAMRKEFPAVKVVVIGGDFLDGSASLLNNARLLGAAATLTKPLDMAEFRETVMRLLLTS